MKSKFLWVIGIMSVLTALLFVLLGSPANTDTPQQTDPIPTGESETVDTEPDVTETQATEPEHSALYISGVSVEDVITYFCEVSLDSEFISSGDPTVIQKWVSPIYYTLEGSYTDEDLKALTGFTAWLNTIDGFPGIAQAADIYQANLRIFFCTQKEMPDIMGPNFANLDGGVTFWYNSINEIYDEVICYRADLDQQTRNSVILEEIYNGLGPVQDTALREDSIIYQYFSTPQALTAVDELILRLLYHPDIKPGMNAEQCKQVIRQLYY